MASVHVRMRVTRDFLLKAKHQASNQSQTGPKMKTQSNAHMHIHTHTLVHTDTHTQTRTLACTHTKLHASFTLRVEPRMLLLLSQQLQDCDRLWPATRTNGRKEASTAH